MKNNLFVYGLHAVTALFQTNKAKTIKTLFIQSQRQDKRIKTILSLAKDKKVPIQFSPKETLDGLVNQTNHQGCIAEILSEQRQLNEDDLLSLLDSLKAPPFLLILDNIQDPHNLGACLRTADAAGVHAVILPKDNTVGLTPTVRKVASGAAETVPLIQVTNLSRTIEQLKNYGIWVMGMTEEAEASLYTQTLTGPIAIVLGQEGAGLRRLTKANCDFLFHIPMAGSVASLNLSVATGITLFEIVRQRF